MSWLSDLHETQPIAHAVGILALVCVLGMALGSLKFRGIGLGIFSGASTNTPALGAGTQTISMLPGITPDRLALPALAYAVTYPTAIVGIIGSLLLLKQLFRIAPAREAAEFAARNQRKIEPLERRTLVVANPNLDGVRLDAIPGRLESRVTISRV